MKPTIRRRLAKVAAALAILAGALAALVLWAAGGIQSPGTSDGPVEDFGAGPPPAPPAGGRITVLTWNIAWAYGKGSGGDGYEPRGREEFAGRLGRIGKAIRESGTDIVLLQEIDFDSHRSGHADQLAELARASGLRYGARAVTWRAGYMPFPYWPPRRNFGSMSGGGAVLSRWPIAANRVTVHPKPAGNSWVYNLFYVGRYSQSVRVEAGPRPLWVVSSHLEAFDVPNREEQARALAAIVQTLAAGGREAVIFGGDFNSLPPQAARKHGFPDDPADDYRDDETLAILSGAAGFREVASGDAAGYGAALRTERGQEPYVFKAPDPLAPASGGEAAWFTFPSDAPNRRLDYLFVPASARVIEARVWPAGDASDHLPVRATMLIQDAAP